MRLIVDVRTAPGSRRHPHFARSAMEEWLPREGIAYRWELRLGGFRRPRPDSVNMAWRHPAFRGYADHLSSEDFRVGIEIVLAEAHEPGVAVMCSETLWWRCHRRLIADHLVLVRGIEVRHVVSRGLVEPHRPTEGAALEGGVLTYPGREMALPL
ncbi:MAG: DUF488 domain-containing protein [Candidatus Dormibacteraeota bacterium]|nr:DUF488 domain-containing protein [Candidatus Dormibacteraeota bacterium]MBV9525748.1 DUF488 domain-containing protein [Candidatus Dormibacteraeota bacterium]